jgi:DNA repair exonuclease SbcCD ATPase subunit
MRKTDKAIESVREGSPNLTRLQVRNFRSLENVGFPLSPLTEFVGPNGAGKTAILRAIELVLSEAQTRKNMKRMER